MNQPRKKFSAPLIIGTLFGAGYLPLGPGTWGSLLFLPFIYTSHLALGITGVIILTFIASFLSLATAPAAINQLGDDPGEFVMDECAGQSLVFAAALPVINGEPGLAILIGGFLLFRVFDIIKPLGIKRAEKLGGKYGILIDDLIAGLYASITLIALFYIYSGFFTA
jgi:phosphatidylglycerophosphatase A